MDTEAYPLTTIAKDTLGASSSVHPIADADACTDDGFGFAVFACDVIAAPSHTTSATGAPDASSSVCSPMDATVSGTSPARAVAIPTLLSLASGAPPIDS
jgi:hypothetical protein